MFSTTNQLKDGDMTRSIVEPTTYEDQPPMRINHLWGCSLASSKKIKSTNVNSVSWQVVIVPTFAGWMISYCTNGEMLALVGLCDSSRLVAKITILLMLKSCSSCGSTTLFVLVVCSSISQFLMLHSKGFLRSPILPERSSDGSIPICDVL